MFFIVNKTKKHITLPDIKISLGPRQAIDLDKIMNRREVDSSRSLKAAVSKGDIEIRIKNGEKKEDSYISKKEEDGYRDMNKLMDEIKDIKKKLSSTEKNPGISKEEIIDAMRQIIGEIPSREIIVSKEQINSDEELVEMNGEIVADINARSINRMVQNTQVESIEYQKKNQENDLLDKIDELEGLLD